MSETPEVTKKVYKLTKEQQHKYYTKFYNEHKDEILTQKSICSLCGGSFTYYGKYNHLKSVKHRKAIGEYVSKPLKMPTI